MVPPNHQFAYNQIQNNPNYQVQNPMVPPNHQFANNQIQNNPYYQVQNPMVPPNHQFANNQIQNNPYYQVQNPMVPPNHQLANNQIQNNPNYQVQNPMVSPNYQFANNQIQNNPNYQIQNPMVPPNHQFSNNQIQNQLFSSSNQIQYPSPSKNQVENQSKEVKPGQEYCGFCKKFLFKLPRHMRNKHMDNVNVKNCMDMEKTQPILFQQEWLNIKAMMSKDVIELTPSYCRCECGLVIKITSLPVHLRQNCKKGKSNTKTEVKERKRKIIAASRPTHLPPLFLDISGKMRKDEIYEKGVQDPIIVNYICAYVKSQVDRPGSYKEAAEKFRMMSKVLVAVSKEAKKNVTCEMLCNTEKFYQILRDLGSGDIKTSVFNHLSSFK